MIRRYFSVYAAECSWIRELEATAAFRTQGLYRGWRERRLARKKEYDNNCKDLRKRYREESKQRKFKQDAREKAKDLMYEYNKERSFEQTARLMGQTDFEAYKHRYMEAYMNSMYAGPEVIKAMSNVSEQLPLSGNNQRVTQQNYIQLHLDIYYSIEYSSGESCAGAWLLTVSST